MNWANAFFVTMACVGIGSCSFCALVVARCLYLDVRRLLAKRRWKAHAVSRSNVVSIGFSPNRRRNPHGFTSPN